METTTTNRVRTLAAAAAVVGVLALAGCGAGQNAATSQEQPALQGVDADAGPMGLRDLTIPFRTGGYPKGSDVPLAIRVVSTTWRPATLSQISPGPPGYMTVSAQRIALRRPATAAAAGGHTPASLVVPPQGELQLVPGTGPYVVAEHITAALRYGESLPVRFAFSTGDTVNVDVPMAPPADPVTAEVSRPGAAEASA